MSDADKKPLTIYHNKLKLLKRLHKTNRRLLLDDPAIESMLELNSVCFVNLRDSDRIPDEQLAKYLDKGTAELPSPPPPATTVPPIPKLKISLNKLKAEPKDQTYNSNSLAEHKPMIIAAQVGNNFKQSKNPRKPKIAKVIMVVESTKSTQADEEAIAQKAKNEPTTPEAMVLDGKKELTKNSSNPFLLAHIDNEELDYEPSDDEIQQQFDKKRTSDITESLFLKPTRQLIGLSYSEL